MQVSSLQKNRPHLESVLGPLSDEEDSKIRTLLSEVDGVLLEIAHHFGSEGAGSEGTGLELAWIPSGQVYISSYVGTSTKRACIEFGIELWPSWAYGNRTSTLTWNIETTVRADCQHRVDHGGMDVVHEVSVRVESALEAALALQSASHDLRNLALAFPLEHWEELASNGGL